MKNIKKIRIGIDLDDTTNNLVPHWVNLYNKKYKDNLNWRNITSWDINNFTKKSCGKNIYKILGRKHMFNRLDIQPNAKRVINKLLKQEDIELYIITAYYYLSCADKVRWVKRNLPNFDIKRIIFCNDKYLIDVDYLIDDSPYNHKGFKGKYILFDKPWNQLVIYPELEQFIRMKNWKEILIYFEKEGIL